MLTKFAAALLATSLIAGSALAAQPSGAAGTIRPPAAQTQPTPSPSMNKAGKTVKHAARHRAHSRKHLARGKTHGTDHVVRHARHAKPAKTHQARITKSEKRS
jgi:hypothetical protein